MTRAALIAALAACDGALGLHATQLADAYVLDASPPPSCPPLGTTAPAFAGQIGVLPARTCRSYSFSATANLAVAECGGPQAVAEGPMDGPFAPSVIDQPPTSNGFGFVPKVAPEGDLLVIATQIDTTVGEYALDTYARVAASWQHVSRYQPGSGIGIGATISEPSRGPDRRLLYGSQNDFPATITELVDTGVGEWNATAIPPTTLPNIVAIFLSDDGRRALFVTTELLYADRPDLMSPFGTLQVISSVPDTAALAAPFMTADCGLLYFDGLDTIAYVAQR